MIYLIYFYPYLIHVRKRELSSGRLSMLNGNDLSSILVSLVNQIGNIKDFRVTAVWFSLVC